MSNEHRNAQITTEEIYPQAEYERDIQDAQGGEPDAYLDAAFEERNELAYEGAGFPGCGDGSDDLADFNQAEADDYRDE